MKKEKHTLFGVIVRLLISLVSACAAAGACLCIPFNAANPASLESMTFGWPFKSLFMTSNAVVSEYFFPLKIFPWAKGAALVSFNVVEFLLSAAFFFVIFAAVLIAVFLIKGRKK